MRQRIDPAKQAGSFFVHNKLKTLYCTQTSKNKWVHFWE